MEGAIFDSFCSLGLSDCTFNDNVQMLEVPAQYNSTAVMVPPSDRFFVSPSTSGTILEEEELTVLPSYHRFFVSPSSSGLITLDQRVKSSEVVAVSSFTSSSESSSSASNNSALELDGMSSSSSDAPSPLINIPGDGIAVSMDSDDPYQDFKQSMHEMLHHYAKAHRLQTLDWDLLEELLFCYLELNDRSMHRFIIKAFAAMPFGSIHWQAREEDQINL